MWHPDERERSRLTLSTPHTTDELVQVHTGGDGLALVLQNEGVEALGGSWLSLGPPPPSPALPCCLEVGFTARPDFVGTGTRH